MVSSSRRHQSGKGSEPVGDDLGYAYPRDEFDVDDWGGPVGAHRAARKGWLVALPWLVGAAVVLLLTGVALSLGLGRNRGDDATVAAPTQTVTTQPTATVTGNRTVTGNGTATTTVAPAATGSQTRAAENPTTAGASTTTTAATDGSSAQPSDSPSATTVTQTVGGVNKQTRIQILNSTRRNGLAHQLQTNMRAAGWNVASVDTYRKRVLPSVVYYRSEADRATAQGVAALYGLGVKQTSSWSAPVTLMIGSDFKS